MYLRITKRKNQDGSEVAYYQLAHNKWDPETKRSKTTIIHSFGRADELDRAALVRLAESVGRVCGAEVRDPLAEHAEASAARGDCLPPGVKQLETWPVGAVWAIEALWERLGIGPTLRRVEREAGCTVRYERALLVMTANRLCQPESKYGTWDRWLKRVYLPSCWDLELNHMYQGMDLLFAHSEQVEETVFFHVADLFNLEVDLVFYDMTTCTFSIDEADEDDEVEGTVGLRKYGKNSEGVWAPQVKVALAVTRDGLPVRSWVFPGNTSDVTTVAQVKKDLRGWKLGRALFVGDAGMNSEDNRKELARACGRYVLAVRAASVAEVKKDVLSRAGRYKTLAPNLRAKEVEVGKGEMRRRYVVCHNPKQEARQAAHRQQVVRELEAELAKHRDRDATAKWAIELMASRRYGRYLTIGKGSKVRINRKVVREAARHDGKWVVVTNDDTLGLSDVAAAYKGLMIIEQCFRTLKSGQIYMDRNFHWAARRVEAHVKICILALLIERVAVGACGRSWPRLREALDRLQVTEYQTESQRFFRRNTVPAEAGRVLKALDIQPPKQILSTEP